MTSHVLSWAAVSAGPACLKFENFACFDAAAGLKMWVYDRVGLTAVLTMITQRDMRQPCEKDETLWKTLKF